MDIAEREKILEKAKKFFKNEIASNHRRNVEKLTSLDEFVINPFLERYLAKFAFGDTSSESIAKAIAYPRILGTSISTTFGNSIQKFCSSVLSSYASTTAGMDIEFVDAVDGRYKYCQTKAGPQTINKDDVPTITNHFRAVRNLARTNNLNLAMDDLCVGVFYGEESDLSANYKKLEDDFPVFIGRQFWLRLTGDDHFYSRLIDAFADVAEEMDSSSLVEEVIKRIAEEIEKR